MKSCLIMIDVSGCRKGEQKATGSMEKADLDIRCISLQGDALRLLRSKDLFKGAVPDSRTDAAQTRA